MEKKRIKLDELKKDSFFEVPERYFDELPSKIQSRVSTSSSKPAVGWHAVPVLKWAMAAVPVIAVAIYFFVAQPISPPISSSAEEMLAQIENDELIAYLELSDASTEDLISGLGAENIYLEDMTDEIFIEGLELEDLEGIDLYEEIDLSEELM
ncbi:MAG: hypothetical protein RJQ09_16495 [Cyclobacteriaceae bacterium]